MKNRSKKRSRAVATVASLVIIAASFFVLHYCPSVLDFLIAKDSLPNAPKVEEGYFAMHVMNVGQGDSILLATDDDYILIDTGDNLPESYGYIVDYLSALEIKTIDCLVLTHTDADHIGGTLALLDKFAVKNVLLPRCDDPSPLYFEIISAIETEDCISYVVNAGDTYTVGDITLQVLAPLSSYSDANNQSTVIKAIFGGTSVLLMGDAEYESESDILTRYTKADLASDILKVGHHGADNATSASFLSAVSPEYAVISCGEDNEYGHPLPTVLARLAECDAEYYRTDRDGTVVLISDGESITVKLVQ